MRLAQMTTTVSGATFSQYAYTYNNQDLRDTETFIDPAPRPGFANGQANYTYNQVNELVSLADPRAARAWLMTPRETCCRATPRRVMSSMPPTIPRTTLPASATRTAWARE